MLDNFYAFILTVNWINKIQMVKIHIRPKDFCPNVLQRLSDETHTSQGKNKYFLDLFKIKN